jgi:biopolymer transport protein ExbB/TolQ
MAVEALELAAINATMAVEELITEVGRVGKWVEAIGLIVILWIGFEIVYLILAKRRKEELEKLRRDMGRMEKKLDKLVKKGK